MRFSFKTMQHAGWTFLLLAGLLAGCSDSQDPAAQAPATQDSAATASAADTAASAEALASGHFVNKGGQETSGTYRIERSGEDLRLVLAEDFHTNDGPDLHVVLSPTAVDAAENENAMAEGAEVVAELSALSGPQTYDLSDELDLATYQSVLIHCVEFTHLYGAAPLERAESE